MDDGQQPEYIARGSLIRAFIDTRNMITRDSSKSAARVEEYHKRYEQ